jgi:hypothetical protein
MTQHAGDAPHARSPSRKDKEEKKRRKKSGKEEKKRKHGHKDKDKDKHRKRRAASHSGASSSSGGSSSDAGGGRVETPARELARLREACAQLRDVLRAFPQVPRKDLRTLLWSVDAGQGVDLTPLPGAHTLRACRCTLACVAPRRAAEHVRACVSWRHARSRCGAAHGAGAPV